MARRRKWYCSAPSSDWCGLASGPGEIWPMTLAFIPRFLALSLVTGVSLVAATFVLLGLDLPLSFASHAAAHRSLGVLVGACMLADVALTFVTPALALSVHSWREALRRGLRMLWETWPASALYAFTPGITIFALSASASPKSSDGTFDIGLVAAAGAVLALWFKGAIVAFYVRRHPGITDGGAAYAVRLRQRQIRIRSKPMQDGDNMELGCELEMASKRYPRRARYRKRRYVNGRFPGIRVVQSFKCLSLDFVVRVFSFS